MRRWQANWALACATTALMLTASCATPRATVQNGFLDMGFAPSVAQCLSDEFSRNLNQDEMAAVARAFWAVKNRDRLHNNTFTRAMAGDVAEQLANPRVVVIVLASFATCGE